MRIRFAFGTSRVVFPLLGGSAKLAFEGTHSSQTKMFNWCKSACKAVDHTVRGGELSSHLLEAATLQRPDHLQSARVRLLDECDTCIHEVPVFAHPLRAGVARLHTEQFTRLPTDVRALPSLLEAGMVAEDTERRLRAKRLGTL